MTMTGERPQVQAALFRAADSSGDDRAARTRNSMLWAAYGDALGFISELTDARGLERRIQGTSLDRLMPWRRRVGGRGGVEVMLPAGCWSDDTQLRMAVSRSITQHGFDVETFARVELPVWPSYALGGGRASKAAAKNLATHNTLWYANTFPGWHNAGGNGAAMRIQPHVWASPDLEADFVLNVVMDSICTHGHPRAIVGACFHASTLAHCLRTGAAPTLRECIDIASALHDTPSLIERHRGLNTWLGQWESATSKAFGEVWQVTLQELNDAIDRAGAAINGGSFAGDYRAVCAGLGLSAKEQQGSGILTSVAAAVLAATAPTPHDAMVIAVNELGTDTDTIATMAGALLGVCHATIQPPETPADSPYLIDAADRLTAISQGGATHNHEYPDTLTWVAPQTQADALVADDGQLVVEGLGSVEQLGSEPSWSARKDFAWQWVRTEFGQSLLIKRRRELRARSAGNAPEPVLVPNSSAVSLESARVDKKTSCAPGDAPLDRGLDVDAAVKHAREHINDNGALGYTVRRAARDGTINDLIAVVASLRDALRR